MFVSTQYKAILGFEEGDPFDASFATWLQRIHPEDRPQVEALVSAYLQGHTQGYQTEFRSLRKDGSYVTISARGAALERDAAGVPTRMIGTQLDISDRRRAERAEARALKAEGLLLMAGSIAHDFNNIFQTLQTSLDLAHQMTDRASAAGQYLKTAQIALHRAVDLSRKMLV